MEFREFSNPEADDYDITSSIDESRATLRRDNSLMIELIDLVGILEDEAWVSYGMSEEEYMNPTRVTIKKVKKVLQEQQAERKVK